MTEFVDLSHEFYDGMPGFKLQNKDGSITQYSATIKPFLTHDQTRPSFNDNVSFEISQLEFQSSVGTYLDSPYHRYPDLRDISEIGLSDVILDGIVIDVTGYKAWEEVSPDILHSVSDLDNTAVLFHFGWDQYWGSDEYFAYPLISKKLIEVLIDKCVKLVGVDTINIDNSRDLSRPAHSLFLKNDILIVENLTNLGVLKDRKFRFFAVPIKARDVAAMPVRAFAEVYDNEVDR